MFKLDMNAIRKSASDTWLMAIPAIPAILAIKSGENGAENSQQPQKIANIAKIAISQQLNCTLQAVPASTQPHGLENLIKPHIAAAANDPAQGAGLVANPAVATLVDSQTPVSTEPAEPPIDPNAWRVLAAAYHAHHFKCPACIAAGRGAGYGLRCGTGAALWTSYSDTTEQPANKGRP